MKILIRLAELFTGFEIIILKRFASFQKFTVANFLLLQPCSEGALPLGDF